MRSSIGLDCLVTLMFAQCTTRARVGGGGRGEGDEEGQLLLSATDQGKTINPQNWACLLPSHAKHKPFTK